MTVTDPQAVRFASRVERDGDVAVVTFTGTMSRGAVSTASRVLEATLLGRPVWVVADLTEAVVDSGGVAVLALIGRQLARQRVNFAVVTGSPELAGRVREVEVRPRVPVYPTLGMALTATGTG